MGKELLEKSKLLYRPDNQCEVRYFEDEHGNERISLGVGNYSRPILKSHFELVVKYFAMEMILSGEIKI